LPVVATTEATDPTRVSTPFRTTANVAKSSSVRPRDESHGSRDPGCGSSEKEVMHMAAKKKAAKKTAAKKKPAAKKKK